MILSTAFPNSTSAEAQIGHRSRLSRERQQKQAEGVGEETTEIPTYYDQPALKPSLWGWKVSGYMFIAGLAGSAQILATAADFSGREEYARIIRTGRYIALAGATIGGPLLIIDLHTPQRFYNMLRIFRPTSPMSIGTYVLLGFGGLSAALAGAQLRRDLGAKRGIPDTMARATQLPAAALGAAMSTYTGALLGATSTPLWAAAPRLIPALFGASAMASAAAVLSLAASGTAVEVMGRIEAVASLGEGILLEGLRRQLQRAGVRTTIPVAPLLLAAAAPVLHQIAAAIEIPRADDAAQPPAPSSAQRRSAAFGRAAGIAVIGGAFLLRHAILRAGNRSAQRPHDYFRLAAPR